MIHDPDAALEVKGPEALRIATTISLIILTVGCGAKTSLIDNWYRDGGRASETGVDADISDAPGREDADRNRDGDIDPDRDTDPDPDRPVDIRVRLEAIEGMVVEELPFGPNDARFFELRFSQPADHENPEGQTFWQFMTLIHRSESAPFVLLSTGYDNFYYDYEDELTYLLRANQLVVEHRFFGESRPEPTDWSLLTIEQSAADTHRVVEALGPLYPAPWISTGASKGGMTSIYHRRFYPDDVVATVAYVAPISLDVSDERYIPFIDEVGGDEYGWCRERLTTIQLEALTRREDMVRRIDNLGLSFEYTGGAEGALESLVTWLPFTFWQYSGTEYCDWVPTEESNHNEIFDFLENFSGFESESDEEFQRFLPYYYQASTELGSPAIRTDHIEHLIETSDSSWEELLPGVVVEHDPLVMEDIATWVATQGSELMFIYGEVDPWTAASFDLGEARDSFFFVEDRGTHYASIGGLRYGDRTTAYDALERWTGVTPWSTPAPGPRRSLPGEPILRVLHPCRGL